MSRDSSRRGFLVTASLAGAAIAAGGATGGCGTRPKPQVEIDRDGRIVIHDRAVAKRLADVWDRWRMQVEDPESLGTRAFTVSFDDGKGDTINSLCGCNVRC